GDPLPHLGGEALVLGGLSCRQADQAADYRKDVLDSMAQLPAENLDLLALSLGVLDVGAGPDPAHDLSLGIAHRHRAAQGPSVFAAMMTQAILDLVRLAGRQAMTPGLPGPLPVAGVEHRLPVFAIGRTRRRTGELVPASIEIIVVAIGKRRPHHVGQRIGQGVEASVALAQRIAGRDEVRFQLSYRYGGPRGLRLALPNADRPDWLQQPSCFTP